MHRKLNIKQNCSIFAGRFLFWLLPLMILHVGQYRCHDSKPIDISHVPRQFSAPESLILYYWDQLFTHNYKEALNCFKNFDEKKYREHDILPMPDMEYLKIDSFISIVYSNNKTKAVIKYRISCAIKGTNVKKTIISGDKLILTSSGWRIDDVLVNQ